MEESIEIVEYRKKNVFKGLNAANNKLYKTSMLLVNELLVNYIFPGKLSINFAQQTSH